MFVAAEAPPLAMLTGVAGQWIGRNAHWKGTSAVFLNKGGHRRNESRQNYVSQVHVPRCPTGRISEDYDQSYSLKGLVKNSN